MVREGYGIMDGSQRGRHNGGHGRNRTTQCRNPLLRKKKNNK